MRDFLLLYINGTRHEIRGDDTLLTLSTYLRERAQLVGTKVVCAEGDCGACTVVKIQSGKLIPFNSCIASLAQLDCEQIITVEGIASADGKLGEIQSAMVKCHGSQCGFCTPGFVMALTGFFDGKKKSEISEKKIKNALTGNLCRCTGYQPIIEAALSVDPSKIEKPQIKTNAKIIEKELARAKKIAVKISSKLGEITLHRNLNETLKVYGKARANRKKVKIFAGGTDLGVLLNKGKLFEPLEPRTILSLKNINDLKLLKSAKGKIEVGAQVTLTELEKFCENKVPEISSLLHVFASPQIKNVATLVGNIANGSPIGDMIPTLYCLDARIKIVSLKKTRWVEIQKFYKGYKKFDLKKDEIITAIEFKVPNKESILRSFKVAQRKDLDISYVSASFYLEHKNRKISVAKVSYGGVSGTVVRLGEIEKKLIGKSLENINSDDEIAKKIEAAITPRSDVRGSALGRSRIAGNLFRKFAYEIVTK